MRGWGGLAAAARLATAAVRSAIAAGPVLGAAVVAAVLAASATGCAPETLEQPTEWVQKDGYRYRELAVRPGRPGFTRMPKTGVGFANSLSDAAIVQNRNRMNGSGVAVGDVDGDDRPDMFFAAMESRPRLYRNLGNWQFEDVTETAGLGSAPNWSTGAVLVDVDNDGDLDLFLTVLTGPNVLYRNDGLGRFEAFTAGVESVRGSMGAAFADTDRDGDLDLYVANYKRIAARDSLSPERLIMSNLMGPDGKVVPEMSGHFRIDEVDGQPIRLELGEEDQYYLNNGDGTFEPRALPFIQKDWGLSVRLQDVSGDGLPDLYVANDFESPDYFYLGDGVGGFSSTRWNPHRDAGGRVSLLAHQSNSSMSVAVADVNHDGILDLFVPDMLSADPRARRFQAGTAAPVRIAPGDVRSVPQYMQNTLHMGSSAAQGSPFFEAAHAFQVEATDWTWGAQFLDVDLDGWQDLLLTTGHSFDVQDVDAQLREREAIRRVRSVDQFRALILDFPRLDLPNVSLRNVDGERFERADWGFDEEADISHGMALGDFDGDGDLDVVINRLNQPAALFRNDASAPRAAIRFKLTAPQSVQGIGMKLLGQEVQAGGGYLSSNEPLVSIAVPGDSTWVRFQHDAGSMVLTVRAGRLYEIQQFKSGIITEYWRPPLPPGWRSVIPAPSGEVFDDRSLQPLLPRSLSAETPRMATGDLNGDGLPELVIGAARGTEAMAYSGTWTFPEWESLKAGAPASPAPLSAPLQTGDWTGLAISGDQVHAAVSGYATGDPGSLVSLSLTSEGLVETARQTLPFSLTGPVAASGNVIFVGARAAAGRYPESVPSAVVSISPDAGLVSAQVAQLEAGLATAAAFADMDGDDDPDLAVSTDWGPIKVFRNDGGTFTDTGLLDDYAGLWRGVTWGDVDGDGTQDIIATNWGWNSRLGAPDRDGHPVRLYYGDFDSNGTMDLMEAEYREDIKGWSPLADFATLRQGLPVLNRRISSWHAYAESTVEDLIGPDWPWLEVNTLASMVFLNRGDRFEPLRLPYQAQWTAGNGVRFDNGEILIAQNFFPVYPESTTRQDAGTGLRVRYRDGKLEAGALDVFGDQRDIVRWAGGIVISLNGADARWLMDP